VFAVNEEVFAVNDERLVYEDSFCEEVPEECEGGGQEEIVATYFGFMQITRGSVIPGLLGFNNVNGQAAVVSLPNTGNPSAVPLPAAGWMLIAAMGGLGVAARRKKS